MKPDFDGIEMVILAEYCYRLVFMPSWLLQELIAEDFHNDWHFQFGWIGIFPKLVGNDGLADK